MTDRPAPMRTPATESFADGALPARGWRLDALAFLTASVTLFVQVLAHRLVSAKLLNNYAFLVISLTMLGFAVSGAILSRHLPRVLARPSEAIAAFAALFALTLLLSSFVFCR